MDFFNDLQLSTILHAVSQGLLIPTILLLLGLIVFSVYTIGSFVVECMVERRHYKVEIPKLVAKLQESSYENLPAVIEKSGLLQTQKKRLSELVSYLYLPEDSRVEVARRLLADENTLYQKELEKTDSATKIGPMLGLMGTLIPLGPGLLALSSGDLEALATSLIIAFDTTVAGLMVAVVCYLATKVRRRWYSDYLVSIENALNAILEKGALLHGAGYSFPAAGSGVVFGVKQPATPSRYLSQAELPLHTPAGER